MTNADPLISPVQGERRVEQRLQMARPCKIFEPRDQIYLVGSTVNLSPQGLLLEINRPLELNRGDRLHLAVALTRRQGFFCQHEMVEATVLRSAVTVDDRTVVGLRLSEPLHLSIEARRPYLYAA